MVRGIVIFGVIEEEGGGGEVLFCDVKYFGFVGGEGKVVEVGSRKFVFV